MFEIDARNEADILKSRIEALESDRDALDSRLDKLESAQREHKEFIDAIWKALIGEKRR